MKPCAFCGTQTTLLCDGDMGGGKTCDKPVCRKCAGEPRATMHLNMGRKGCRWDTRDICPDCVKAGRDWPPKRKEQASA